MSLLGYTERGDKIVGILPFDFSGRQKTLTEMRVENEEFDQMKRELRAEYGDIWFDRDRENNRILFLTNRD